MDIFMTQYNITCKKICSHYIVEYSWYQSSAIYYFDREKKIEDLVSLAVESKHSVN